MRVSVIIPSYNAAADLPAAIRSIQTQTIPDWEVIVIDDASTDATPEIVQAISEQDARIRYVRNPTNLGPAGARNAGLKLAQGEWIALLDADDGFRPDRLEKLITLGAHHSADLVSDNLLLCNATDGTTRCLFPAETFSEPRMIDLLEYINGCYYDKTTPKRSSYVFMHPMFRREFLENHGLAYHPQSRNGEDFLLYLDCFASRARWFVSPEAMYIYSVRDGSLTEVVRDQDRDMMIEKLQQLSARLQIPQRTPLAAAIQRHIRLVAAPHYYDLVKNSIKAGNYAAVLAVFRRNSFAMSCVMQELRVRAPGLLQTAIRRLTAGARAPAKP